MTSTRRCIKKLINDEIYSIFVEKAIKRLTISVSESDINRLEELKVALNQKTYSKVIQILVRLNRK